MFVGNVHTVYSYGRIWNYHLAIFACVCLFSSAVYFGRAYATFWNRFVSAVQSWSVAENSWSTTITYLFTHLTGIQESGYPPSSFTFHFQAPCSQSFAFSHWWHLTAHWSLVQDEWLCVSVCLCWSCKRGAARAWQGAARHALPASLTPSSFRKTLRARREGRACAQHRFSRGLILAEDFRKEPLAAARATRRRHRRRARPGRRHARYSLPHTMCSTNQC